MAERPTRVRGRTAGNSRLETAVITLNTTGAVLAVLGSADWIAVTVAAASQCMSIIDYFYIPSQLQATNKALENCHNLLSYWDSLSLVQAQTRGVKRTCCQCVEGAILEITSARTATSAALPGEAVEEAEE